VIHSGILTPGGGSGREKEVLGLQLYAIAKMRLYPASLKSSDEWCNARSVGSPAVFFRDGMDYSVVDHGRSSCMNSRTYPARTTRKGQGY